VNRTALLTALGALALSALLAPGQASSHREAPLISSDPLADNTDVYAFVSPASPGKVTLAANFIPFESAWGGPNFSKFDDNVLYEIMVDNNGDAVEDITYQFRFTTEVQNPNTFLYNTGPITSIDDPDFNVRQYYSVTRVAGPRRTGARTLLSGRLPSPPVNIGHRSTPNYGALAGGVQVVGDRVWVFAGQRDDSFFVDLGAVFDLIGVRRLPGDQRGGVDGLKGYNVHTIAIEVPIEQLTRSGAVPTSPSDPAAVIGVWSTASRPATLTRTPGGETHSGNFVQVSRLGQPLVNEVVIPRGTKDAFNSLEPTGDGAALNFVLDPEVPKLLNLLFGIQAPPAPRNDLVTIFLTGIPGLNQPPNVRPSEQLRLNVAIPPSARPNPMGVIGGDLAGFPNGRRFGDDVVDIALRVMAGATPLTPSFNGGLNARLGDGVDENDAPYLTVFPYAAIPWPGNDSGHIGPSIAK
jgi:hypothetical protein